MLYQLATQGWGLSSALLTLLLAFPLLINMSWGGEKEELKAIDLLFASASGKRLGVGGQNRLKISASRSQGNARLCGFQFSVASADESSRKSRFNCKLWTE